MIDTVQMTVSLPQEKVYQIFKEIQNILQVQPKLLSVIHVIHVGLVASAVYQCPLFGKRQNEALPQFQTY